MISYGNDKEITDERIKTLTQTPDDEELLLLYGLYKQVTLGNNHTESSGMLVVKESCEL